MINVKSKPNHIARTAGGSSVNDTEINALDSNQEETDTRAILYAKHSQDKYYKQCMIHTPDSEMFNLLMYQAHTFDKILFLATEFCEVILGLHVCTDEDRKCAFNVKGETQTLQEAERIAQIPVSGLLSW